MQNVILVIHILACIAMTGVILLQRSEGGALGIGGGGGGGGLMSGRGAASALLRTTMIFGGIFFITSLTLTTLANRSVDTRSDLERELEGDAPAPLPTITDPLDLDTDLLGPDTRDDDTAASPTLDPLPEGEDVTDPEINEVPENERPN